MPFIRIASLICCVLLLQQSTAQLPAIKIIESGKRISLRGLSVVDDNVIWASGSSGSVARSVDGGNTFTWITVAGYEKRDFRDIEAFDENTAIIMGIAEPAIILKTSDGGKNWRKVFEDSTKGMFLDAMVFGVDSAAIPVDNRIYVTDVGKDTLKTKSPPQTFSKNGLVGIVVGDPVNGKMFFAITFNDGETWESFPRIDTAILPGIPDGEAFFASSGTNVSFYPKKDFKPSMYAVSGGKYSNLWNLDYFRKYPLPIIQGKGSTGANSIAMNSNGAKGIIVGGDFANDTITTDNCVLVSFGDTPTFNKPSTAPHGYRSCVIYIDEKNLLTCGTSGIDISRDGGMNWELISKESFHVCQKAKKGNAVFLAGANGRIAKLVTF